MITKRVSQLIHLAQLAMQNGKEIIAHRYYTDAAKLIARRKKDRARRWASWCKVQNYLTEKEIERTLAAGYSLNGVRV